MPKEKEEETTIDHMSSERYLGDTRVISRLLRGYVHSVITHDKKDGFREHVKEGAEKLASVFLGENKKFPGPPWNTPGMIDVYVARECGVSDTDPKKRVAGALVKLACQFIDLANEGLTTGALPDGWEEKASKIMSHYVLVFSGIPSVLMI